MTPGLLKHVFLTYSAYKNILNRLTVVPEIFKQINF
jgi:hypothetical protein